jgi:hypothetical protein
MDSSGDSSVATEPRRMLSPELGLLTLGAAILGAVLIVPRASQPVAWPMPHVDFAALKAEAARNEVRRAERAGRPLPHPLRRVGERLRRVGAALFVGELPAGLELGYRRETYADAVRALTGAVAELKAEDREDFLELGALQSELFVKAVHAWQESGAISRDLLELGGDFAQAAGPAWRGPGGQLSLSDRELKLLFRVRFALLTETEDHPNFKPSRDELLAYYGLLLARPPADPAHAASTRDAAILAISALEPGYPADFAHGLVEFELGRFDEAAASFLSAPDKGSWARLRQNALLAARAQAVDDLF